MNRTIMLRPARPAKSRRIQSRGDRVVDACVAVLLTFILIVTLYPLWLQFITSISHGLEVMKGGAGTRWRLPFSSLLTT